MKTRLPPLREITKLTRRFTRNIVSRCSRYPDPIYTRVCVCVYIHGLSRVNQLGWLMEGRVAREKGAGDGMGRTEVDRHGRKRCHRCQLPFSWISSSRHKERFTRWDGSLGPSRKRFLSRGIVVVYSFIGNGNSKFPPGGIFSDSPPDLGPIFFSPVIVYRSDDNLIPIQFCRRWCRFRRISVRNYRERRRGKAYLHSGVSRHVAWKRRARFIQHVEFHRSRLVSSDFADDDDVNYTGGLYTIYPPVDKELRILAPFLPRSSFLLPTFWLARRYSHPILVLVSPRARNGACHNLSRASRIFSRIENRN